MAPLTPEHERLRQEHMREANWQRWGTYLPERQWGTVREDYSAEGNPWTSFTHDMARYRAYRWGEDGLLGWTDRRCRLCFSTSLWNGRDPILKERLFGLANPEGNHGEDVKELYYYLDATPTHSYARALYKYPQAAFPYDQLVRTNAERGFDDSEYELLDTGIFDENRYFDVMIEYAKADVEDMLIRLTITNRGPERSAMTALPTLTLRNNWSWDTMEPDAGDRPFLRRDGVAVTAHHASLGEFRFTPIDDPASTDDDAELLLTANDTNIKRLDPSYDGLQGYSKDGFDRFVVGGEADAIDPGERNTKAALLYRIDLEPGQSRIVRLRLVREDLTPPPPDIDLSAFDDIFARRRAEADAFYAVVIPPLCTDDQRAVTRQAYAGLLWTKQFYYFVAQRWQTGDPSQPAPPKERGEKNADWGHLFCRDILSMPDKWEYPWFAAWDLAFHMVPMARIDPQFAKDQLILLLREWYLHPNGQMPSYEGSFSDVNPPVHAYAVFMVYATEAKNTGRKDTEFLERAFQKLIVNFTWWVNRNDAAGRNLFGGGFLGLDNIGVFDRNMEFDDGQQLDQADATAWMGLFCAAMLRIATELAQTLPAYEDIAGKFFDHYVRIIDAVNTSDGSGLWDDEDGFYFDRLVAADQSVRMMRVHSIVGLVPLFGIVALNKSELDRMPGFRKRFNWFLEHNKNLAAYVSKAESEDPDTAESYFLSLVPKDRLRRVLTRMLDSEEFLSDHGVRSLSKFHQANPYEVEIGGEVKQVRYAPAESMNGMFGGNSNWRGPVWLPINGLLVSALQRYHGVYGEAFRIECPTGSGQEITLGEVAKELSSRVATLFLRDEQGRRACHGMEQRYIDHPDWNELVLFNEYFCGDTGRGIGASHQTGWTALAATFITNLHGHGPGEF